MTPGTTYAEGDRHITVLEVTRGILPGLVREHDLVIWASSKGRTHTSTRSGFSWRGRGLSPVQVPPLPLGSTYDLHARRYKLVRQQGAIAYLTCNRPRCPVCRGCADSPRLHEMYVEDLLIANRTATQIGLFGGGAG